MARAVYRGHARRPDAPSGPTTPASPTSAGRNPRPALRAERGSMRFLLTRSRRGAPRRRVRVHVVRDRHQRRQAASRRTGRRAVLVPDHGRRGVHGELQVRGRARTAVSAGAHAGREGADQRHTHRSRHVQRSSSGSRTTAASSAPRASSRSSSRRGSRSPRRAVVAPPLGLPFSVQLTASRRRFAGMGGRRGNAAARRHPEPPRRALRRDLHARRDRGHRPGERPEAQGHAAGS